VVARILGAVVDITDTDTYEVLSELGNDIIIRSDLEGVVTYISRSVKSIFGLEPEQIVGRTLAEMVGRKVAKMFRATVEETMRQPDQPASTVEYNIRTAEGRNIWMEARPSPIHDARTGRVIGFIDVVREITARKDIEARLSRSQVIQDTLLDKAVSGILLIGHDGTILAANEQFAKMWGVDAEHLVVGSQNHIYKNMKTKIKNIDGFRNRVDHYYDNDDESGQEEIETVDGRFISRYTSPVMAPDGFRIGRAWFFWDITENKTLLARAEQMARRDALTGLANRRVFTEAVQHAIAEAARGRKGFAILYLDLDQFKTVNDTLGHLIGDELLKAVADRLRSHTREVDTVARLGGDEFAIVASDVTEASDVARLAAKLIAAIAAPFEIDGVQVHASASIGIDIHGPESRDVETLLSHADLALYRAKAEGRNGYRFFTDTMDAEVRARVAMAAQLQNAMERGELFLCYRPRIALRSGRIVGIGVDVRWRHPERGVIEPSEFMPAAEKMGLAAKLGKWVLETACREARVWNLAASDPIRVALAVSPAQFRKPLLLEADIAAALAESGLSPALLELELGETVLMNTTGDEADLLDRLRATGVGVTIDDFGAGYTSFADFRRSPANRIKIASALVQGIGPNTRDAAIVRAIIAMGRELGFGIVADGVGTTEQSDLLGLWGCDEAQGDHIYEPRRAEEIAALFGTAHAATATDPTAPGPRLQPSVPIAATTASGFSTMTMCPASGTLTSRASAMASANFGP
jgi:diguanylate cyclase (GGDEF)-like protein/PAS domain S-box-containing protein